MTSDPAMVLYAICPMDAIAIGEAKAFDLVRLDDGDTPKPFRIVVVRKAPMQYLGYVNACPHEGVWLNIGSGSFFDSSGTSLECGRHGAKFDVETGRCLAGPCEGQGLEPVTVLAESGDICITGIRLQEDDPDGYGDDDETMEIMIHPE